MNPGDLMMLKPDERIESPLVVVTYGFTVQAGLPPDSTCIALLSLVAQRFDGLTEDEKKAVASWFSIRWKGAQ